MKLLLAIMIAVLTSSAFADSAKTKIRYEYKKFEKFDFDEIGVEGESGAPGDLSISPRVRNEFQNRLPERANFNQEMRKSVEGIR